MRKIPQTTMRKSQLRTGKKEKRWVPQKPRGVGMSSRGRSMRRVRVGWLVGFGGLVGRWSVLVGWLVGWLVGFGGLVGGLAVGLGGGLVGGLAGWVGWWVGWWVGRRVG